MSNIILEAARFAHDMHFGVPRKYSGRPYIEHPARVAAQVSFLSDSSEFMVAAAWLHDVIEDCQVQAETLEALFGSDVARLVVGLTNVSKKDSSLNREGRKKADRERMALEIPSVKVIKLIDRIDNLEEGFADSFYNVDAEKFLIKVYHRESKQLLDEALRGVHPALEEKLDKLLLRIGNHFGLE